MKNITFALLLAALLLCSGCETFHGFKQDMEKAGQGIEKVGTKVGNAVNSSADWVEDKISE